MGIVRQIKNVANGYSSSQVLVRDATANNEQPPPLATMQSIASSTYDPSECMLIMDMLDKRLNDKGKYWRHVLKALVVLDYLVHFGGDRVLQWCAENLYIIKTLREFNHRDDAGRDVGGAIRARARDLTSLLMDTERLKAERGSRRRRPRRYRQDSSSTRNSRQSRRDNEDDDLKRAIEMSKETAAREDELRRMSGRTAEQDELNRAAQMTAQNTASLYPAVNYTGVDPYLEQLQAQQAQLQAQLQAQQTGMLMQAQADYEAQQQAQMQAYAQAQQEAQMQAQMQQQAQQQAEYDAQQAQLAQAQAQYEAQLAQTEQQLQPLKTGSNNPFAAFNAASAAQTATSATSSSQFGDANGDAGAKPRLHRQSTFDKDHMDRLDQILSLEAPMDTFGNTGSAKIPAQHTENTGFVDSSGRGLTAMLTARQTGQTGTASSNPFSQYTQPSQSMQPAHTGYGFGNENSASGSSANLIDL